LNQFYVKPTKRVKELNVTTMEIIVRFGPTIFRTYLKKKKKKKGENNGFGANGSFW
jgi:hypothetical protein